MRLLLQLSCRCLIVIAVLTVVFRASAQLSAFPGAEGFGAIATGGRHGDVYHVTNLSRESVPGSFVYGLATAPAKGRTIVFDVSGYIPINGKVTVERGNVTIAGQTAPGHGIGFRGGTFLISAGDVVIRHVRFRNGHSADTLNFDSRATNCIMDHCDVLLGKDENLSSFRRPADNFTFQWSINAWGMENHSAGGLWDFHHATCHHSLWSHNHTRNPKARPALLDWVNNVTFDWDIGFIMGDSNSQADWKANVVGSYFICPPGNLRNVALEKANLQTANGQPNFSLHLADCAMDANGDGVLNASKTGGAIASGSYATNASPYATTGIPVSRDDYLTAYKKIISAVGPLRLDADPALPLRDELDTILVSNVVNQLRHHVSNPAGTGASGGGFAILNSKPAPADSDRDGMPDFWETPLGSKPGADDHANQVSADAFISNHPAGYTLLEEYLHFLSIPHSVMPINVPAAPASLDVDLHKYTQGFTNRPPVTYRLSNVTNGSATLRGNHVARFIPTRDFSGRARFDFTVTDGDGSTWTQPFAILVCADAAPRKSARLNPGQDHFMANTQPATDSK